MRPASAELGVMLLKERKCRSLFLDTENPKSKLGVK